MTSSNETLINTTTSQGLSQNNYSDKIFVGVAILGTFQILNHLTTQLQGKRGTEEGTRIKKSINMVYISMISYVILIFIWIDFPDDFSNVKINLIPNIALAIFIFNILLHRRATIVKKTRKKNYP